MHSDLKYRQIFQVLSDEIASGKYEETGRLPSENQLVERYHVSRPTVSRALRDLQNAGLIERRAGAGSFLIENLPPSKKSQAVYQLALLVPRAGLTEIFEVICGELAGLARAKNCSLIWGGSGMQKPGNDVTIDDVDDVCGEFIDRAVSGVFFAPFELKANTEAISDRIAQRLQQAGIAVILLDRDIPSFPARSNFDLVGLDNFTAGYLLADHLIKMGQHRLVFFARPYSASTIAARIAGAKEAISKAGLAIPPNFTHFGDPENVGFVRGLVAGNCLDGIICGNDATAVQLLNTLAKIKVKVPEELRVVGFDDVRYAQLAREPLTTINQPCREIAATAMAAMLERIHDPTLPARAMLLNPKLTVRSTCGAYLH
jgi:DNA-binding LacI/PurR family transcriptional regulator